jgi:hypothetical protein
LGFVIDTDGLKIHDFYKWTKIIMIKKCQIGDLHVKVYYKGCHNNGILIKEFLLGLKLVGKSSFLMKYITK